MITHRSIRRLGSLLGSLLTLVGCSSEESGSSGQGGAAPDAGGSCIPRAEEPSIGPSGYPLDGWSWTRHGVLFEDPGAAETDGYIAPAVVVVGDTLHLWVTRKQGLEHRIWHATSTDGVTFSALEPTTGLAGENIIAYPSALHDGSRFRLWYGSGSIDVAESTDGTDWTMVATNVLGPGESGAFDSLTVLYPSVIEADGGYTMLYTGFDGARLGIGRALSADGVAWSRPTSEAVLTIGAATEFDNNAVAQPCAVPSGTNLLVWYGGYDTSLYDPGPYRIGHAVVSGGSVVARRGVTLDLEPSGVEAYSTRDPAVTRWQGRWWMAYVGMGDDRRYRIMRASSENCAM